MSKIRDGPEVNTFEWSCLLGLFALLFVLLFEGFSKSDHDYDD